MKFSLTFVLSVFVLFACCASAAQYSFSMTYKMYHATKFKNGFIPGTLFYRWNTAKAKDMRVYYKHTVYSTSTSSAYVVELENYERPRTFKKCGTTCEVLELARPAEPWYYQSSTDKATTTKSADGFYTRYTRTQSNNKGIVALWLNSTGTPSAKYLYKIEYKDGYTLEFNPSSYATKTFSESVYNDNDGAECVTDVCDPYMDVIYVFDESGSIKASEFEDMKDFAKKVTAYFTVSERAAAIGLVTYAGNIDYTKAGCVGTDCVWKTFKDPGSSSSYGRCSCDQKNVTRSGNKKLTRKIFELTTVDVNAKIQSCQQQGGNTCQGYGLLSAWEMMVTTNFRTLKGLPQPYSVVIGLTDGADACPNKTYERAQLIKGNLRGSVIEVGIGLDTIYDKDFLKRVASVIDGTPAYYDAKNFKDLANKVTSIATKVCTSTYSSESPCKTACSGYCGCEAKCYCPTCSATGTKCVDRKCSVSSDTTAGCQDSNVNCEENDKCFNYGCDPSKGCTKTEKDCTSNLYTCQVGRCSSTTGCIAEPHNEKCPPRPCHTAKCLPNDPGRDQTSGCVYTNTCVGPSPTTSGGCIEYSCTSGECKTTDICTAQNTNCTKYKCNVNTNKCEVASNVTCTDGPCQHGSHCDLSTGTCVSSNKDDTYCKAVLQKAHPEMSFTCSRAYCDADHNEDEHCLLMSLGDNCDICGQEGHKSDSICQAEASALVTTTNPTSCFSGVCFGYRNSDQSAASTCNITENVCTPPDACHITTCGEDGFCKYTKRNNIVADKCHKVVCNPQTGLYEFEYTGCGRPDRLCQEETCDGETGSCTYQKLYEEVNCSIATCNPETGEVSYAPRVCEAPNRCFTSTCIVEKNECQDTRLENDVACNNSNKCVDAVCEDTTGKCTFTNHVHVDGEGDQCRVFTCLPESGEWVLVGPKCDDGLICTVDSCDYNGTCSFDNRICQMNMTGFGDCFISACSENRKNGCYRKIVENSYFDECGNCIGGYINGDDGPSARNTTECKKALTWEEKAAAISAGVAAGIAVACVVGAVAVSAAGTLLTRELIRRAKAAADSGAVTNPIYEDNGREMANPAFEGNDA